MACMSYQEFRSPKYGREDNPKIYLTIAIVLTLLLIFIYTRYFHKKRKF